MWLAEDGGGGGASSSSSSSNASSGGGGGGSMAVYDDPGSPPLEGGEALSELIVEPNTIGTNKNTEKSSDVNLLTNLASILDSENNSNERLQDVFPVIQDALPSAQPEVQLAASNNFLTILEKELVPHTTFTETFLQSILASVDNRDPVVANAWIETLMDVIDLLPKDVVKQDILSMAVSKGQMSQPVTSRLSCCRMLGKICGKFEPYLIKKEILPVVQSLCQDVDHEVRGCMCRELDSIARGLGLEATKSAILPELVELANDVDGYVRLAGIETVVNMLSLLDDETCTQTIVPLVRNICDNCIKFQDVTLLVVAKQLGKLCHGLSVNLTMEQKGWFLDFYREVARLGLPYHREDGNSNTIQPPMPDIVPQFDDHDKYTECRHCCAYNLPAMVLFAGPNEFEDQLYNTFHDLASDPYVKVRRTIGCGVHEVAKLLGPCVYLIQREIISLLQDDSLEVLKGLITHLPITLEALAKEGTMGSELKFYDCDDVMAAVVQCEDVISRTSNWRLSTEFLEKLSCLPKCLSSNSIFHRFVPLFFRKLFTARPIPCRVAAASTLLVFLRSNPRQDQRQEICYRIIDELGRGRSCHNRMLFITICDLIIDNFSHNFFKQHFFLPLLDLCGDRVANVRLRLCAIIPRLKTLLRFPSDKHLQHELETCVGKLLIDEEDRDVSAAVRHAILELDKIEVAVDNTVPPVPPRRSQSADSDRDDDDKAHQRLQEDDNESYVVEERNSPINQDSMKSPERKSLQTCGKIPIRRSLGGSPEMRRSSLIGSSTLMGLQLTAESPINDRIGISFGGFSRIPTLQTKMPSDRSAGTTPANSTPIPARRQMMSPSHSKPVVPPRTSIGSPLPSPESMRRSFQSRTDEVLATIPSSPSRRKSLGPGVIVPLQGAHRNPRPVSITNKPAVSPHQHHQQSHIPRYLSSPLQFDEETSDPRCIPSRLRLLSLPNFSSSSSASTFIISPSSASTNINNNNNSPLDDYDPELLELVDEGEESPRSISPHPDIMLALAQRAVIAAAASKGINGQTSRLPVPSNQSPRGGGKMYAHWSRSHTPRCTTPPICLTTPMIDQGRVCRSASSSPTHTLRSFIPRYVGNPTSMPTSPNRSKSICSRSQASHQRASKAASLPTTPHSISPTRHLSLRGLPRTIYERPSVRSTDVRTSVSVTPNHSRALSDGGESKDVCSSRSVRNLVRELESLSRKPNIGKSSTN